MIIAITGATGFVGQAVLDEAARQGLAVRALTRREQQPRDGVTWVRGDLADHAALSDLINGTGAVLHIAGVVNAPSRADFLTGNVDGTGAVVQAARMADVTRFVCVSSLAAREPGLSDYGHSKRMAEELVQTSRRDWTIIRPPAIYGPRDTDMFELFRLARRGIVPLPPRGRASAIHVEDLARLLIAACQSNPELSQRIFEPDDGHPFGWSHEELARAIGWAVGQDIWPIHLPEPVLSAAARIARAVQGGKAKLTPDRARYMAHPDWVSDIAKAVPVSLWTPDICLKEGLAATAAWYKAEGWL